MFKQFFEVFWPKAVEYVAEQGLNNALNIKDFEQILENMQNNLMLLSAKAFDVETEIKNAEDSGRKKRKREVEVWLEGVKSIEKEVDELGNEAKSKGFIMRFLDGGKAAKLNGDIYKLVQQRLDFGEPVLDSHGSRGETLLTNEMVGKDFNENSERILKLLENRQVSRIGIYGMGGVGKTTLAKHIYNRLVQEYEGHVIWVTVSQEFTIKNLQDKIARFMGVNLEDEDEEAFRATKLKIFLTEKKIAVLILDDVWENIDMNELGCAFSVECCRLIITTRSSKVCDQIGCKKVHVEKLCEDEAGVLFNETLGNEIPLCPQVEGIAKSMAKLCDGLPLGIITVAGSMKGETAVHTWRNALAELKECVECVRGQDETGEVDEVFKVLRYSFYRLKINYPSESNEFNRIQLCFLYCSLYPEDYEIVREDLVRKFISEGLVDERKSRRARVDQGHSILDKLVNVCLLESYVERNEECVKMHDLVRSMALKICKGKYMVRAGERSLKEILKDEEWTKGLEKVSFASCGISRIGDGISPDCPKLSTLLLWRNHRLEVISESFFSKMQGLCTLDLYGTRIRILPNSVSDLKSLKALLLENCVKLEKVPYLGKLKALRELNLSITAIEEVPQGVEELVKLEFLSLMNARNLEMIPSRLFRKLMHLQHVSMPYHLQAPMEEIQNLKLLEEFHGTLNCVEDFNCFMRSRESHETCYTIIVGEGHFRARARVIEARYKKKLGLFGCNLEGKRVLGQDTEYVSISECKDLSISFMDAFSGLKSMRIWRCGGIEWLLRSDGQGSQFTLEEIELWWLDDVKGITTAPTQPAVFSSLKGLSIVSCRKMRKVGLPVSTVPKLERILIESCGEIEEIFEECEGRVASNFSTLPKLTRLRLYGLPRLRKVGLPVFGVPNLERIEIEYCGEIEEIFEVDEERAASTLTLPKLTQLILEGLRRLKSISKATIICSTIEEICISQCPSLMKKLPLHFDDPTPPPSLRRITVEREWWESLEWDININPNLPLLLQPFLQFPWPCSNFV